MFDQRLQILVSREQRQRLERQARQRGISVSGLVREAVDQHVTRYASRESRIRAAQEIAAMSADVPTDPDELRRLIEQTRSPVLPER